MKNIYITGATINAGLLRCNISNPCKNITFENVIINRENESITGDYAKINTLDESYFVKTNDSKRVKVILEKKDE